MEVGARELAEAVQLLLAEFPDAPQSQLESVLRECGCDISAARRRLYELQESQQHAGGPMRAATPKALGSPTAEDEEDGWGWGGFNQGMRDLGLEQLGAQLSLFGRQVASSIGALLPAELNPFGPDEDEVEEYEARAAAKAAQDARRERETAALTKEARHLQARRHGGGSGTSSRQRSYSPEAMEQRGGEAEEVYDDDKLE